MILFNSAPHKANAPEGAFFVVVGWGRAGAGLVLRQKIGAGWWGITALQRWILFLFLAVPGLARRQAPGQGQGQGARLGL